MVLLSHSCISGGKSTSFGPNHSTPLLSETPIPVNPTIGLTAYCQNGVHYCHSGMAASNLRTLNKFLFVK